MPYRSNSAFSSSSKVCGAAHSANADGSQEHASAHVDQHWPQHRNQVLAVLKAIRETDASGASVGDPVIWSRMVEASIADAEDDRG